MQLNKYDLASATFVDTRNHPAADKLGEAVIIEDYLYSTNSFYACRILKDLVGGDYKERGEYKAYPDVAQVFVDKRPTYFKQYDVDTLLGTIAQQRAYMQVMLESDSQQCSTCDGDGYTECYACSTDVDCQECDGSGTETTTKPVTKIQFAMPERSGRSWDNYIAFDNMVIDVTYFAQALLAIVMVGCKKVEIGVYVEEKVGYKSMTLKGDGIEILIMGVNKDVADL